MFEEKINLKHLSQNFNHKIFKKQNSIAFKVGKAKKIDEQSKKGECQGEKKLLTRVGLD